MPSIPSKKKLLKRPLLYVILDREILKSKPADRFAARIACGGARMIQLRDKKSGKSAILKEALRLRCLLKNKRNIIFIVNDYLEIAKIADSDGIHLGQYDTSVKTARKILGPGKIIGISCHSLKQAFKAQKAGADYISIGPVFPTPLKAEKKSLGLGLFKKISRKIKVPCFAIGGINENNIREVLNAGAKSIAVCRAACAAKNPKIAVQNLLKQLNKK